MEKIIKYKKNKESTPVKFFQGLNVWIVTIILVSNVLFQFSQSFSSVFKYIGFFVLIVALFIIDMNEYIYLFVSLMSVISFASVFGISIVNVITLVYFYKAYIYDNKYVKEKDRRRLPSRIVIPCVVWILYCVQFLFEGSSGLDAVLLVVKQLLFLVYMADNFRFCKTREEAQKKLFLIEVYYVVGVIVATMTSVVINGSESIDSSRMTLNSATGINRFGVLLAFSMIFILLEFLKVKNLKEWFVLLVSALFVLYFCFATKSRNCMITVLVSFVAVVFYGLCKRKSRLSVVLLIITIFSAIIFVMTVGKDTAFYHNIMKTVHRFVNPSGGDITNGRTGIWEDYLNAFVNDTRLFLLGSSERGHYSEKEAHNIILDLLSRYGVIGFLIVSWVYAFVFVEIASSIKVLGKTKINLISLWPLFMVLFMGMASSLSLLTTNPTVNFCMGAAIIYLFYEDENQEPEQSKRVYLKKNLIPRKLNRIR